LVYIFTDGAELLLDLGLPSGIIGGVVLPLLGAIPDSAMILFSGVGGSVMEANEQLSVGMGYVLLRLGGETSSLLVYF
jgi:hypothetical protein